MCPSRWRYIHILYTYIFYSGQWILKRFILSFRCSRARAIAARWRRWRVSDRLLTQGGRNYNIFNRVRGAMEAAAAVALQLKTSRGKWRKKNRRLAATGLCSSSPRTLVHSIIIYSLRPPRPKCAGPRSTYITLCSLCPERGCTYVIIYYVILRVFMLW